MGFLFLFFSFVLSMAIFLLRDRVVVLFLGWDGLGASSFLLIIHYSNWKRLNGGVFTFLSNRAGDALLLILFSFLLYEGGGISRQRGCFLFSVLFLVGAAITKRAQTPVSAWLPAAMAAPTPVSRLVHSSTLVTAGALLLIKCYGYVGAEGGKALLAAGLITIVVAGARALREIDFKKLVALSTLRQIGILFFILGRGRAPLSFFHLVSHAFFKRALFLGVGATLHSSLAEQDGRLLSGEALSLRSSFALLLCRASLCGLFFTGGFLSKDLFLEGRGRERAAVFYFFFLFFLSLTFLYVFRLLSFF